MGTVLFACAFVFVAVVGDLSCLTGQSHQQVDSAHNEIVFKFGEREFSKLELDKVRARHFAVVKFLEALEKKARQMPADDFYSGLPPALRISPANSSTDNPDQIDSIVMDTGKPLSARSIKIKLVVMKAFSKWLVKKRALKHCPFATIDRLTDSRSGRCRHRREFSDTEFWSMVDSAKQGKSIEGVSGPQRAVLYQFASATGIRLSLIHI